MCWFSFFFFSFKAAAWCFELVGLCPKYSVQPPFYPLCFSVFLPPRSAADFVSLARQQCLNSATPPFLCGSYAHGARHPRSNKSGAGRRWKKKSLQVRGRGGGRDRERECAPCRLICRLCFVSPHLDNDNTPRHRGEQWTYTSLSD